MEGVFEKILWSSRLVVLVAVVASMLVALGMFYVATVDVFDLAVEVSHYASVPDQNAIRPLIVAHVVEVVDGYLLATIMLIFSLGLYELFISKIDIAEKSEVGSRLLLIRSLDDLKDRLAKVVLLILVVKFFEYALRIPLKSVQDLVMLGLGLLLVAGALWLTHSHSSKTH